MCRSLANFFEFDFFSSPEKQVKPSKITIGNLKKPTVFKQVEDAEKQRRSKYEDGEITPSEGEDDDDNSTDKEKRDRSKLEYSLLITCIAYYVCSIPKGVLCSFL